MLHDPFGNVREEYHVRGAKASVWAWSVWLAAIAGAGIVSLGWVTLLAKLAANALQ